MHIVPFKLYNVEFCLCFKLNLGRVAGHADLIYLRLGKFLRETKRVCDKLKVGTKNGLFGKYYEELYLEIFLINALIRNTLWIF